MKSWLETKSIGIDVDYIRNQLNEDVLKPANLILNNTFIFIRTWDMEPCHIPYHLDPLDWHSVPNEDEEWTFMLNRFTYLSHLALAEIMTENLDYLYKGKALMMDWIKKHQSLHLSPSTRTLDTAMRISSWLEFMPYLYRNHLLNDEELKLIQSSIQQQVVYMYENYIPKYHLSNWGSIQTATILYALPLLDGFRPDIGKWAYEEFIHQMEIQIYDDGLFWEQSTMYQVEVLTYALKIINVLPEKTQKRLHRLAEFLLYQMTPKGTCEPYGDSDVADLRSVLNLCAIKFLDGRFKVGTLNNIDNLYTFDRKDIEDFKKLKQKNIESLSYDGETMFTHRKSWDEKSHFTLFTNGSMGSGHAHVDYNHLSLYFKGNPIIVDSGRYTYREDHPYRIYLKEAQSHSGLILDNESVSRPSGSWTFESYAQPLGNMVKHNGPYHYYKGIVYGDFQLWERIIIVVDQGIWLIVDKIKAKGKHHLKKFFNLHPSVKIEGLHLNDLKMEIDGELSFEESLYAPRYNQIEKSKRIVIEDEFENETINQTVFYDKEIQLKEVDVLRDGIVMEKTKGLQFDIASDYKITIVLIHRELFDGRKNLECNGVALHAKASVIEERNGEINYYELSTI